VPKTIISYHDPKFISHYWRHLWKVLGTKLLFSIAYHPQTDRHIEVSYEADERAKEMKKLHEKIIVHVEKAYVLYKVRANKHRKHTSYRIWLHLRKERFSSRKEK